MQKGVWVVSQRMAHTQDGDVHCMPVRSLHRSVEASSQMSQRFCEVDAKLELSHFSKQAGQMTENNRSHATMPHLADQQPFEGKKLVHVC